MRLSYGVLELDARTIHDPESFQPRYEITSDLIIECTSCRIDTTPYQYKSTKAGSASYYGFTAAFKTCLASFNDRFKEEDKAEEATNTLQRGREIVSAKRRLR